MSRALLRRLEAIETMLAVTEEPITVRLLGWKDDGQTYVREIIHIGGPGTSAQAQVAGKNGCVRMMQIEPDGREQVLEIGPRPARNGKQRRRRKNGRGRGGVKNAK